MGLVREAAWVSNGFSCPINYALNAAGGKGVFPHSAEAHTGVGLWIRGSESGHLKQKVVRKVAATDPGRVIEPMAGV